MFSKIKLLWIGLLVGFASCVQAAEQQNFATAEIPIFAQKLRFKLPVDWKHAHTAQNDTSYLIEFIPQNEDISNWTNLFSIQGLKDFDPLVTPEQVAQSVATSFKKSCPDSLIYENIGARLLDEHNAFLTVLGCANIPSDHATSLKSGMSEITYYVFVKGQRDLYIAHRSVRGAGFSGDKFPTFVEQAISDMKNFFPIEFCTLESAKGECNK